MTPISYKSDRSLEQRKIDYVKHMMWTIYNRSSGGVSAETIDRLAELTVQHIEKMPLFENPSPILQKPKIPLFRPMHYPQFYQAFIDQNSVMWLPDEQPMSDDLKDWYTLPENYRFVITNILRFFVQSDLSVGGAYTNLFLMAFHHVDLRMMILAFANIESIHAGAYAHLIDSLGLPEVEYSLFTEYKEMSDKFDYYNSFNLGSVRDLIKALAVFSLFTEGMQLYSSFAILYFPSLVGKLKGTAQIISWSIRDEMHHFLNMTKVLNILIKENKHLWTQSLKDEIYEIGREMIRQEDCFIDLAMSRGNLEVINEEDPRVLTKEELHGYVRYLCNERLKSIGLEPMYDIKVNPLPWMDDVLSQEHANFFETESTDYSKNSTRGTWDEVNEELDSEL